MKKIIINNAPYVIIERNVYCTRKVVTFRDEYETNAREPDAAINGGRGWKAMGLNNVVQSVAETIVIFSPRLR